MMDLMTDIVDETIKKLKEDEQFENWSDEKFSRLKTLLTTKLLDTEEDTEKLADAFLELVMEEDVSVAKEKN